MHKKKISNSPSKKKIRMSKSYISLGLHLQFTVTVIYSFPVLVRSVKVEQDHAQYGKKEA